MPHVLSQNASCAAGGNAVAARACLLGLRAAHRFAVCSVARQQLGKAGREVPAKMKARSKVAARAIQAPRWSERLSFHAVPQGFTQTMPATQACSLWKGSLHSDSPQHPPSAAANIQRFAAGPQLRQQQLQCICVHVGCCWEMGQGQSRAGVEEGAARGRVGDGSSAGKQRAAPRCALLFP